MAFIASIFSPVRGSWSAIAAITSSNNTWVIRTHPLRLPRNGGTNRSITGAQTNFNEYGSATRLKNPMVARSTFAVVIHACSVLLVR